MDTSNIGYVVALATATANGKGESLSNDRGSITQATAQFFSIRPTVEMIESACEGIALGYAEATAKGFTVSKKAPQVLASMFRKLGSNAEHVTYKKSDDDTIIAFGHGSLSKEYLHVNEMLKTTVQKLAELQTTRKQAMQDYADNLAELDRREAELTAQLKAELA